MDKRRYHVDYDWLWTNPPHNDGTPATLRLTVTDGEKSLARQAVDHWFSTLTLFPGGDRGQGGWAVSEVVPSPSQNDETTAKTSIVLDIIAGGEDVLDAIAQAAESAYTTMISGSDLVVTWQQLPRKGSVQ
ncbi:hypothetical protein ACFPGO_06880 [Arcanobacterium canis]|uniref:DUF3145 domain-containing protein n=1 Tax=Arcanobacterium canis TaxID=999183 RepID=A0ABY8FYH6_9ACTO|nr:hypothetical protein [Arcanobacterium canis]WFM83508.1 hypothetical protein P7079_00565 [Arcanobacterium canis]